MVDDGLDQQQEVIVTHPGHVAIPDHSPVCFTQSVGVHPIES